jgi:predicted phosphodiesterase
VKIAVLSDIHSAAEHFRDALGAARTEGFDQLVILGDLFTYGPDPIETLDLTEEAVSRDRAILITGNHDLLYLGGSESAAYASKLPEWIRESVEWTSAQLRGRTELGRLPWQDEWQDGDLLLSHANPFGAGDWTYLRDAESAAAAAKTLRARSFAWGIFGHVHRFRIYDRNENGAAVCTVGSIGQPRDKAEPFGQWAMITTGPKMSIDQRRIDRDWRATVERIREMPLSEATKERLCQFYP